MGDSEYGDAKENATYSLILNTQWLMVAARLWFGGREPFAPFIGDDFILMQDNARAHSAQSVQAYLSHVGIPVMQWPANSPDMNPIEHVWDLLKRRVKSRMPPPNNLNELGNALLEEWERLPQEIIDNIICSMPRRMETVIRARGGNTRY